MDGSSLSRLRSQLLDMLDEASAEVERESGLTTSPRAELLVVDRHAWIGGNTRTLQQLFGEIDLTSLQSKVIAWEGGVFVGLLARAVLAQYDPFRDQLLVVYPNLGDFANTDGLKWLLLHEVTHVAQFRAAPWIADQIVATGRSVLSTQSGWTKDAAKRFREALPDIVKWLRDTIEGKSTPSPLFDLLPDEQREAVRNVNAIVTLLEGHATHITELAGKRVLDDYDAMTRRLSVRKKRPTLIRLLEAIGGIEMKRQQYVIGNEFCKKIWELGGPGALAPAWRGPEWAPTTEELANPESWLARVGAPSPA
jgi:coenzyme F420 biosynthesis associated uncharacterized protein